MFLKERTPYHTVSLQNITPVDFNENGLFIGTDSDDLNKFSVFRDQTILDWHQLDKTSHISHHTIFESWVGITSVSDNNETTEYHLFNISNDRIEKHRLSIRFDDVNHIIARKIDQALLLWHPEGRLCIIDLEYGSMVNDFSI